MKHVPRIFLYEPLADGSELVLKDETAHHLLNVLRVELGAALTVFNGEGGEYAANVTQLGKRDLAVRIGRHQATQRESPLKVTLAQALSRGERMDYAIQKAVELGVASIQPLITQHSLRLEQDRALKKITHWQAVAQSAAEQCGRDRVPSVQPVCALSAWAPGVDAERKLMLDPQGAALKSLAPARSVTLLVGPEGGLGPDDLQLCEASGFQRVALGPRILRTETAGAGALAALQTLWGDLG
ncbi:MAG: 16S rRNA (uracil(1498)-N(3))-methyltransferase [Nevskiales bacterium]